MLGQRRDATEESSLEGITLQEGLQLDWLPGQDEDLDETRVAEDESPKSEKAFHPVQQTHENDETVNLTIEQSPSHPVELRNDGNKANEYSKSKFGQSKMLSVSIMSREIVKPKEMRKLEKATKSENGTRLGKWQSKNCGREHSDTVVEEDDVEAARESESSTQSGLHGGASKMTALFMKLMLIHSISQSSA